MSIANLEDVLNLIAAPFDKLVEAKGSEIEAALPPDKKLLVDDLDALHWDRSRAMAEVAYETGLAVGKQLGRTAAGVIGGGDTRLCEDLAGFAYRAVRPANRVRSASARRRGRGAPRRSSARGAAWQATGV